MLSSAIFLLQPHYCSCSLDCSFYDEAFWLLFLQVDVSHSYKIRIQQRAPCGMVRNLLELHGQAVQDWRKQCLEMQVGGIAPGKSALCWRLKLQQRSWKQPLDCSSCQKGGEWDLQWEVKLILLVIKRTREMCWKQGMPMRPLSCSPKQIAVLVEHQLLSPSNCSNQVWSCWQHESPLNFLISGGQVFKIFLDAFPLRFLPASDL